jgi:hypothetical protein
MIAQQTSETIPTIRNIPNNAIMSIPRECGGLAAALKIGPARAACKPCQIGNKKARLDGGLI